MYFENLEQIKHKDPLLQKKLWRLQAGIWLVFYTFLLLYAMQKWEYPRFGFWAATISTAFYFLAVYVNAMWLIPRYYKKQRPWPYILLSILVLGILLISRMELEYKILLPLHQKFYSWTLSHFSFVFITNFLAFAFGALLRVSIDYLFLLKQQEEMRSRQLATELHLLKSQVQPHFLFNTLNNIYYLAYTKNERTPEVIAKLSDIMRYFVDEAQKEKVLLSDELKFLENYIELEQIRMLHPVDLSFKVEADTNLQLPPMLLIPLVENIFKHGIDKTVAENKVCMELRQDDKALLFTSGNSKPSIPQPVGGGMGLKNLDKRLRILYGDEYELRFEEMDYYYKTSLKIPL